MNQIPTIIERYKNLIPPIIYDIQDVFNKSNKSVELPLNQLITNIIGTSIESVGWNKDTESFELDGLESRLENQQSGHNITTEPQNS